ncbi:MAG TPA: alanine--tRNA ligase [Gaiellaceae bacterium]|jgi:alanyl-tRNA synthetase|nr:alanine--tRNA ligase [Gaiellaceae bacterium]
MRTTAELRAGFRAFFESKGHAFRPSASLVPRADDRSTLLISAGMQPLMPFFLGREQPPAPLLTTVQKVFRVVDIDEVGLDTFHLTFFEMLGNFSFGQYFKDGAIELATEFIRDHMRLDWDRLWVSVFAGDPELGLGEDEVAIDLWERIGMPPERIVRLPRADNFWSVGGPGPCGPDSEIFFDWGEGVGCGRAECAPGCGCERFLEFWNLVFMEYELHADGTLTPLPKQNIDTGMGLERAARILQDVPSVFDTDGYQALMTWLAEESGVAYGDTPEATKAHRILADHGRGMTFLAADGVAPSNEGRGYVMRRIVRRAVQQAARIGLEPPFLARLADVVVDQMGDAYPELLEHRGEIHRVLSAEEERFSQTLARGLRLFEEVATGPEISGEDAFRLHDTYGFPIELTQELARERGLGVNDEEFTRLMAEQRERSRRSAADVEIRIAADAPKTRFVGYEKLEVLTAISALEELGDGLFQAKLFESPFYPEGGGQVMDAGFVENEATGARAELVEATRLEDDQVLTFQGEGFAVGDRVRAVVPWSVRFPTMANHTATHLLHKALQDVLGDHVRQAGSAVRPDKLRFDFTHPQALSAEERAEVERRVNEKVFENLPVHAFVTPIDEARRLGAMMLFGEKYGEHVRVVEVPGYSRELCGGTHVRSTAEIGPFVILSEGSVGAGARRIEAVTSGEAWALLHGRAEEADELRAELERARKERKREPAAAAAAAETDVIVRRKDGGVVVAETKALSGGALRDLSDQLKHREQALAVLLGSAVDGRAFLVVNLDKSLADKGVDAAQVVREVAPIIGGGGGGRPTLAEAGGRDPNRLEEALAAAERHILSALA